MILRVLLGLSLAILAVNGFSRNAIGLGLVSKTYPLWFWDSLANMTDADLNPEFRRFVLYLDRERAGNEHWCCHSGRAEQAKVPVYNDRGEVVAWNTLPCAKVGCCDKYLEVANHCLDKDGQKKLLAALDVTRERLSPKDTADLIALLKEGGASGLVG